MYKIENGISIIRMKYKKHEYEPCGAKLEIKKNKGEGYEESKKKYPNTHQ